jgi:hypothetical protein
MYSKHIQDGRRGRLRLGVAIHVQSGPGRLKADQARGDNGGSDGEDLG